MIPPDQEIYEVEKRIAERRERVERAARESARGAMRALSSPWALAGAALIGFLAAGGLRGDPREDRHYERRKFDKGASAAKAGGLASLGMAAATWLIKSQFGSPLAMAQFFLAKMRGKGGAPTPSPVTSPFGDKRRATRSTIRP